MCQHLLQPHPQWENEGCGEARLTVHFALHFYTSVTWFGLSQTIGSVSEPLPFPLALHSKATSNGWLGRRIGVPVKDSPRDAGSS